LNGRNGVSPEIAIRPEMSGWGSAESWLRNQLSYDLWRARRRAASIKNAFPRRKRPEPTHILALGWN